MPLRGAIKPTLRCRTYIMLSLIYISTFSILLVRHPSESNNFARGDKKQKPLDWCVSPAEWHAESTDVEYSKSETTYPEFDGQNASIVVATRNRHQNLRVFLASCLVLKRVSEIIVVDWASDIPVSTWLKDHPANRKVKLIRVVNESNYVLTRAFNLGFRFCTGNVILKVDADIVIINDNFLELHWPKPKEFFRCSWEDAKDENAQHLNGVAIFRKEDIFRARGYDERLQSYGYDDTELYSRLKAMGAVERNIDLQHLYHIPHTDLLRSSETTSGWSPLLWFSFFQNMIFTRDAQPWQIDWNPSVYTFSPNMSMGTCDVSTLYANPSHHVSPNRSDVIRTSCEWALHKYKPDLDWTVIKHFCKSEGQIEAQNLMRMYHAINRKQTKFVAVYPRHGLGNRIRALCSCLALARYVGYALAVVWERDAHLDAAYLDLFQSISNVSGVPVLFFESFVPGMFHQSNFEIFDYMSNGFKGKGAVVNVSALLANGRSLFYTGSFVLNTSPMLWERIHAALQSLSPSAAVEDLIRDMAPIIRSHVGLHIRNMINMSADVPNAHLSPRWEDRDVAMLSVIQYRRSCSTRVFIEEMRRIAGGNGSDKEPSKRFFVAADHHAVISELRQAFPSPGVVRYLGDGNATEAAEAAARCDGVDRRRTLCQQRALADIYLLSMTETFVPSVWSSFSEIVQFFRIGPTTKSPCQVDRDAVGAVHHKSPSSS